MEAIFNVVNRPRPRVLGMNEKLIEFLRTKSSTFGGSVNPLDADDWLRAILRELEPSTVRTATRFSWQLTSSPGRP
jgi:LmbE family N-acetylglucosaminyl deacetylase